MQVNAPQEQSNKRKTNVKAILGNYEYTPLKITRRKEVKEKDSKDSERTTVNPVLIWRKQVAGAEIHKKEHNNRDGGKMRFIKRKKEVKNIEVGFEKKISGDVSESQLAKLSEVAAMDYSTQGKFIPTPRQRAILSNTKLHNSSYATKRKSSKLSLHVSNITEITGENEKETVETKIKSI